MKKLICTLISVCVMCFALSANAANNVSGLLSINQTDLARYIIAAGVAAVLLGMLFLLFALLAKVKSKQQDEELYDEYADYAYEPDKSENLDNENTAEEPENETEAVVEESEADGQEDSEADEAAVDDDADDEDVPNEETADNEAEDDAAAEDEPTPEPESEKMNVRITLTGINNPDVKIVEFADIATVGRRGSNSLIIADNAVSGEHCRFKYANEKVWLEDMDSTNGTIINGDKITETEIETGDIMIIGKNKYRLNVTVINE